MSNRYENKKELKEGLYFVHGFYASNTENISSKEIFRNRILLHKSTLEDIYALEEFDISVDDNRIEGPILEGQYVFYDGKTIREAENHPLAVLYREINRLVTNELIQRNQESYPETFTNDRVTDVVSYHVNVGHANCSIVVFYNDNRCNVWMVDCAIRGTGSYISYQKNLDACLTDIINEHRVNKISKLFITHQHYDHINGVHYLIDSDWIDKNTEVWLNLNYRHYSTTSDDMLIQLNNIGVKIIDPIVKNSTNQIKILYPDISFDTVSNKPPSGKINNASILYQLCLGRKSMLFPGDIETEGWDNVSGCIPFINNTDYYCISHHGSKTGHLRNGCPSGAKNGIQTLADCLKHKTKHQILMGKNGAYPGIYANEVMNDFKNICKTEDMVNYIKLRWNSGTIEAH